MTDLPLYVWLIVLLGVGVFFAGVGLGVLRRRRTAAAFAAVWSAVVAACVALATAGAFDQSTAARAPWFGLFAGGVFLLALGGSALPPVAAALRAPDAVVRLTWAQTPRVVGGVFLLVWALDRLPAAFALPAGLGDVLVGVSAPFVARRLARGDRRGAVAFHALGTFDLVLALTLGTLAGLAPDRILDVDPSTAEVTLLPLVLIPAAAVPLALALHVVTLRRLARR